MEHSVRRTALPSQPVWYEPFPEEKDPSLVRAVSSHAELFVVTCIVSIFVTLCSSDFVEE